MSLHDAVKQFAFEVCVSLIASGADVNAVDDDNKTPLHHAVGSDEPRNTAREEDCARQQITELLLHKGANVDAKTGNGQTCLHFAAMRGSHGLVEILLENGATVDLACDLGTTALTIAIDRGYAKIVGALVQHGADVNAVCNDVTPLHRAVMMSQGLAEVTNVLLQHGADVNQVVNGRTALHLATIEGHVEVMKALLTGGANVNVTNDDGETPLKILVGLEKPGDCHGAFALLLEQGADPTSTLTNGQPLLHKLVDKWIYRKERRFWPVMQLFFNAGVSCNATDTEGQTLLHKCAGSHEWYYEEVQMLLSNDADIDAQNGAGETALHLATKMRFFDIVQILIGNGANTSVIDSHEKTPLDLFITHSSSFPSWESLLVEQIMKMKAARFDFRLPNVRAPMMDRDRCHRIFFSTRNEMFRMREKILHSDFTLHSFLRKKPTSVSHSLIIEALKQIDIYEFPQLKWILKRSIQRYIREFGVNTEFPWNAVLNGVPPLIRAISTTQDKWEVSRILRENCKESRVDVLLGMRALHHATENCQAENMDVLIKHGASVNAVDDCGRTPFTILIDLARSKGYFKNSEKSALEVLLAAGADANTTDVKSETLLHVLVALSERKFIPRHLPWLPEETEDDKDLLASMQMLLDSGATVDKRNDAGETALHLACTSPWQNTIQLLLDNGADIFLTNGRGETPLDIVRSDPSCHAFYAFADDDPTWLGRWNSDDSRSYRSDSRGDQKAMVLLEHMKKLIAVGLLPRRVIKYREDEVSIWWSSTSSVIGSPYARDIEKEVNRMKNHRLCCHCTLFDMLFKEKESSYFEFPSLRQALDSINFQDFTHYGCILKNVARKYKHKYIIEGSGACLRVLIKTSNALNFYKTPVLPAEMERRICDYLSFSDRAALGSCVDHLRIQVMSP